MRHFLFSRVNPWLAWTMIALATLGVLVPVRLSAEAILGLVPCGTGPSGGPADCDFNDLLILAKNILSFLMYSVTLPLAVLRIIWAGANMVYHSSSPGEHRKYLKMIENVVIGFFIVFAAYVIVQQSLSFFVSTDADNPIQQALHRVFQDQPTP